MQREKRWNPGCQFKVEDLLAVETVKQIQYQEEKMNVSDEENYVIAGSEIAPSWSPMRLKI